MKIIATKSITSIVEKLCIDANCIIGEDILKSFRTCSECETSPLGKEILDTLSKNAQIAKESMKPVCQDTGMTVVFVEIGQEVKIEGGFIEDAINQGVRQGYQKGYLRKSVVKDPIDRVNTTDNTPAIIHYEFTPGDTFRITVAPKGFGSENMSRLKMLKPSQGLDGIKEFVKETVFEAGANPCPPIIVGIGIGGTMEKCAILSKKALLRPVGTKNKDNQLASLEKELLDTINKMGIGPAGFGGSTTALAVNILTYPTHIAGLPVSVNIGCHATRHAEAEL